MATTNLSPLIDPARLQESRAQGLVGASVGGAAIAFAFVAMRSYTRFFLVRKRFLEDYSIVAAMACAIAMTVCIGITIIAGAGKHIEALRPAQLKEIMRVMIGVIQFYNLAHLFLKLSIMLQYYRVATLPWEKRLCLTIMGLVSAGYLAVLVLHMVRCVPFEAMWTPNYPGARCINGTALFFASQSLNLIVDLIILLAPLVILRHSSAPLLQRLLFGVALAFGGTACIVSALRLHTLLPSTTSSDPTWDKIPSGIYGSVETDLGITCACIVTLRPLFQKLRVSVSRLSSSTATGTATMMSMPQQLRGRPSLYHITLSSGGGTQFSKDGDDDLEIRGGGDESKTAATVSVRDRDPEKSIR